MKLTEMKCRKASPKESSYKLADGHGLYLEISASGGKYWRWKYRFAGSEKRLALGVYPEVGIAEARRLCQEHRAVLRNGRDPGVVRKEIRHLATLKATNTFEKVALEWHELQKPRWSEKHGDTLIGYLRRELFPVIGNLPVDEVAPTTLMEIIKKIESRPAKEIARRVLRIAKWVFSYAVVTQRAQNNPTYGLQQILAPMQRGHYASLKPDDLPAFLHNLKGNDARLFLGTRLAMEFMMLSLLRTTEMIKLQWHEIDWERKVVEIPASRMKMRKSHLVPLSDRCIEILKQLSDLNGDKPYVFAAQRNAKGHMSNNTILAALDTLGYKHRMTGHGFRSLAMTTIMERLDYPFEIPDTQLAHAKKGQVRAAYDRTEYWDQRVKMMQDWSDYLARIGQSNVINLQKKAG